MATWMAAGEAPPCSGELFRVTRNTNANVVVYEARLSSPGVLDEREPVRPVWIMLAEDGRREELNPFEAAMAYGVELRPRRSGRAPEFAIRARPDQIIRIVLRDGCPEAWTRIDGQEATLRQVVVTASGGIIPEVLHVETVGIDVASGVELRERTYPAD
jgi:hypothetical protein